MGTDVNGDPVDDLSELLGGGHRRQFGSRELDGDGQPTGMAAVDDGRRPSGVDAGEKAGRPFNGTLGGREADPLRSGSALEMLEALQGEGQVRSSFIPGQGVDLVHDDRPHLPEGGPAAGRGDQEIEALGGRHQEGRGVFHHGGPGAGGGVAGADGHRDGGDVEAEGGRPPRRSRPGGPPGSGGCRRPGPSGVRRKPGGWPRGRVGRRRGPGRRRRWPPGNR